MGLMILIPNSTVFQEPMENGIDIVEVSINSEIYNVLITFLKVKDIWTSLKRTIAVIVVMLLMVVVFLNLIGCLMLLMKDSRMKMERVTISGIRRDCKVTCIGKRLILRECIELISNLMILRHLIPVHINITLTMQCSINLIDVKLVSLVHGLVSVLLLD